VATVAFNDLKIVNVVVSPTKGTYIYAGMNSFSSLYRFFIKNNGEVYGKSYSGWLKLTDETSKIIKEKLNISYRDVSVYITGAYS